MNRLLAMVGLFVLTAAMPAAPPTVPPASPDQLIEQLGSESYAEREAAMTALEKAGVAAIPVLEAAIRNPNPEISKRAVQVLAAGSERLHESVERPRRLTSGCDLR